MLKYEVQAASSRRDRVFHPARQLDNASIVMWLLQADSLQYQAAVN